jgi:hypothetical protein
LISAQLRRPMDKNYRCRTSTPTPGEETGLRLRTMGVGLLLSAAVNNTGIKEFSLQDL